MVLIFIQALLLCGVVAAEDGTTELITTGTDGIGGNQNSDSPDINGDGNIITFASRATDLIPGLTTNGNYQIYTYDRNTQTTTLVTTGSTGTGGNSHSQNPAISDDGNIITFNSMASDLIPGLTTNGNGQIYAYDRTTQIISLITTGANGNGGSGISDAPAISGDGNIITFNSMASDLIAGLTPSGYRQIYAYDRTTHTTSLITTGSGGSGGDNNSYSSDVNEDGKIITFNSRATDLIPGLTINGNRQVYTYDRTTQITTIITGGASGTGGNRNSEAPVISADGNIITFYSWATDLITGLTTNTYYQIYAYQQNTQTITLITTGATGTGGNGYSYNPAISADGNIITFASRANDLITGLTNSIYYQIYTYQRNTQTTTLITTGTSGTGGSSFSDSPAISASGGIITFYSPAMDIISGIETNGFYQIYVFYVNMMGLPGNEPVSESVQELSAVQGVGAASEISMQKTGIPIVSFLWCLLMLMCGFTLAQKS